MACVSWARTGSNAPCCSSHWAKRCTPTAWSLARAALGPIELPPAPQAIQMANTDVNGRMTLGDLVEQEPTRALRVFMKQGPQPGLLNVTELSACTKG